MNGIIENVSGSRQKTSSMGNLLISVWTVRGWEAGVGPREVPDIERISANSAL
jgi:hypothetical protein